MTINTKELLDAVAILTDEQEMKVTLKSSAKGALICGGTAFVGAILLGPIGLAVGGTVGGVTAAYMSRGKFKPVSEVISRDLTIRQREQLKEHIIASVRDFSPTDLAMLVPFIMGNMAVQQAVLKTVVSFISNEMQLQIVD